MHNMKKLQSWKKYALFIIILLAIYALSFPVFGIIGLMSSSSEPSYSSSDDTSTNETSEEDTSDAPDIYEWMGEHDSYGGPRRDDWDCGSDGICDGHEAGYDWGEEHDICDMDYDNGNSEAFNEGVKTYAYENCYIPGLLDEYESEYGVRPDYSP